MVSDDSDEDAPQHWLDAEQRWEDPEARWGDPEAKWGDPEGGFGEVPETHPPEDESPDAPGEHLAEIDVDSRTRRYFWSAVALANIAIAAVSLGLMLIGFRGQWGLGGGLVLVGVMAGARTYRLYKEFNNDTDRDASE